MVVVLQGSFGRFMISAHIYKLETALYPISVQNKLSRIYKPGDTFNSLISRTKDAGLKKLLIQTRDVGYRLETAEGMYYPVINYGKIHSIQHRKRF